MDDIKERIKAIYNDCWKNYKDYTVNYDMQQYNMRSEELVRKYDCKDDIKGLLFWFADKVQTLHDEYAREEHGK